MLCSHESPYGHKDDLRRWLKIMKCLLSVERGVRVCPRERCDLVLFRFIQLRKRSSTLRLRIFRKTHIATIADVVGEVAGFTLASLVDWRYHLFDWRLVLVSLIKEEKIELCRRHTSRFLDAEHLDGCLLYRDWVAIANACPREINCPQIRSAVQNSEEVVQYAHNTTTCPLAATQRICQCDDRNG